MREPDRREPNRRGRWLTGALAASGLAFVMAPVIVAVRIYGYYTTTYRSSFGTPIGMPFFYWFGEGVGIAGAALLVAAVIRSHGRAPAEVSLSLKSSEANVKRTKIAILLALTTLIGLGSLISPFAAGDPTFIEGSLDGYAGYLALSLVVLTILAAALVVAWASSIFRS